MGSRGSQNTHAGWVIPRLVSALFALHLHSTTEVASASTGVAAPPPLSVFVSPTGNDATGDGSAAKPYASLSHTQSAVRALLQQHGSSAGNITVHVGAGRYELTEPLIFDERDHHAAPSAHRVSWIGPPKASANRARVLCGTVLSGWQHAWGGIHKVHLGRRVWNLAEAGHQSNPARHPNTNPGAGSGQLNGSASASGFSWHEGALPANVSQFGLANTTVLMASGFDYYWTESWKVSSFNLSARSATFGRPKPLFPGDDVGPTVRPGPHFYVQGSVGLIDEPGEFAMDAAGEWLYYWPRSAEPIEGLEIVAPISTRPIQIVGKRYDVPVRGLTFQFLEFVASDQDPEGVWYLFNPSRSNDTPKRFQTGLIFTENATDIVIEHCRISAAGNAGIWLNTASNHITIRGNWIEDTAYCGVFAQGWFIGDANSYYKGVATTSADTYVNHHHVIDSNVIHNVGRLNAGAAGVWLHASGENLVTRNYINRSPRNGVGTFGIHYDQFVQENPHGVYEFKGEDALTFESQFDLCHAKNNTISFNEMSNIVRDSCDPGAIESYGVGKGHRVLYNNIHDVTQPPVLFHTPADRRVQVISLLFSDAQTHYSDYIGNLMFEANACSGDGAMIKNVATNFSNNVVADSSMPHTAWIGSYSGPVFDMSFSHNVAWNSTGFCNGGGWPGVVMQPPGPGSPIGIGSGFLSGNYWLDNGYACGFRGACEGDHAQQAFYNRTGAGLGGVFVNGTTTCYHTGTGSYPHYGCNHYPNCNWQKHMGNYHLTPEQLEAPVVSMIDYDLHQLPVNPNMSKALKLVGKPAWSEHSVQATKDPFARVNQPWNTNASDFVAEGEEAKQVGHVPLPVHEMGLGGVFDLGFDRALVGRRLLFREGAQSEGGNSPPKFHMEDMDRVRGMTISASLGLIATAEFNLGSSAWAKFSNVVFNSAGTKAEVVVRAQTNAKGGCGPVPHPFVATDNQQPGGNTVARQKRRHRTKMFEHEPEPPETTDATTIHEPTAKTIEGDTRVSAGAPTCGQWLKNQTSLKAGHFTHFTNVADIGACCAMCQATPPCQFYTWTIGNGACYLNEEEGPLVPCPGQCTTGGLSKPNPPPAPPPFPSPLQLSFSLGAPLPMGGNSAELLGSLTLASGAIVTSGGAESGVFAPTGNGAWCDFTGELVIPAGVANSGGAHDLYISIISASNHSLHRFALDYFSLRATTGQG